MRLEFPTDLGLAIPVLMAALSLRLFRLAWRTRRLPELLVGIYFLLVPSAISLLIRVSRFAPEDAIIVRAAANALFDVGGITMLLFAWSVFRPDAPWARVLAWGGSAALVALWSAGFPLGAYEQPSFAPLVPSFATYVWVFVESFRYYQLLRRRERLGLADPVLVNRFLLFAIWTGGVFAITVLGTLGSVIQLVLGTFGDGGGLAHPAVLGTTRILAIAIGVALWLVFLPPARYQAWLRARAATATR